MAFFPPPSSPGRGVRLRRRAALGGAALICLQAGAATGFEGLWHTEDRSVIELRPCATAGQLCGYIRWAKEGGKDLANPDEALRKRPICGLQILELHRFDGVAWKDGWVYDPEDGKTYQAALRKREGKLFLRGFLGTELFGETETWTPADPATEACHP